FWKCVTRTAEYCVLAAVFLVRTFTLLQTYFAKSGRLPINFLSHGLFGTDLLKPQQLLGLQGLDDITHCLFWSMLVNIGCYVGVSLIKGPNAAEHGQATVFVDALKHPPAAPGSHFWRGSASVNDLLLLVGRFLGPETAHGAFASYARSRGARSPEALSADASLVHHAESLLAGAI